MSTSPTAPKGPKFIRRVLTIEVLGRDDGFGVADITDIEDLGRAYIDGEFSGKIIADTSEEVTPAAMAQFLIGQASDPQFLGLNEDGTDTLAWEDE